MSAISKPIIEPIYKEWWAKGPIVTTSKQQEEDIRLAFYVGAFAMMGLMQKLMAMDSGLAMRTGKTMQEECRKVLYNRSITPKVVAHINGEKV